MQVRLNDDPRYDVIMADVLEIVAQKNPYAGNGEITEMPLQVSGFFSYQLQRPIEMLCAARGAHGAVVGQM